MVTDALVWSLEAEIYTFSSIPKPCFISYLTWFSPPHTLTVLRIIVFISNSQKASTHHHVFMPQIVLYIFPVFTESVLSYLFLSFIYWFIYTYKIVTVYESIRAEARWRKQSCFLDRHIWQINEAYSLCVLDTPGRMTKMIDE